MDHIRVAIGVLFVVLNACFLIRRSSRLVLRTLLSSVWRLVRCDRGTVSEDAVFEQAARTSRIWRVKTLRQCTVALSASGTVGGVGRILMVQKGWDLQLTAGTDFGLLIFFLLCTLVNVVPEALVHRSLDIWISALMACMTLLFSPLCQEGAIPEPIRMLGVLTRVACLALSEKKEVGIFWNTIFVLSLSMTKILLPDTRMVNYILPVELYAVVVEFVTILLMGGLLWHHQDEEEMLRSESRFSALKLGVSKTLLNSLCDAVIELDSDLKIVGPTAKLADMLCHGRDCIPPGRRLTDYAATAEDSERMRQCMTVQSDMDTSMANVVHLRLLDSTGGISHVEAFHVTYSDFQDVLQHLVGLREHSEVMWKSSPRGADLPAIPDIGNRVRGQRRKRDLNVVLQSGTSMILSFSNTLRGVQDMVPNGTFDNCLAGECKREFQRRFQELSYDFWESGATEQTVHYGAISLALEAKHPADFLEALCTITFLAKGGDFELPSAESDAEEAEEEVGEIDQVTAIVKLMNTRWFKRHGSNAGESSVDLSAFSEDSSTAGHHPRPRENSGRMSL